MRGTLPGSAADSRRVLIFPMSSDCEMSRQPPHRSATRVDYGLTRASPLTFIHLVAGDHEHWSLTAASPEQRQGGLAMISCRSSSVAGLKSTSWRTSLHLSVRSPLTCRRFLRPADSVDKFLGHGISSIVESAIRRTQPCWWWYLNHSTSQH